MLAGATAMLAASSAFAAIQAKSSSKTDLVDVVILGAGLSGLGTARLLEAQGLTTLLLEGRDRVGGRIYTATHLPGHPEIGANTMTPAYGRAIDAARWAGVELIDIQSRAILAGKQELVLGGKVIARDAWPTSPLNPFPDNDKKMMPWEYAPRLIAANNPLKSYTDWTSPASKSLDIPLADFLKSHGATDAAINLAYNTIVNYGTSAYDVSALMLEFIDAWIKSQSQAGHAQLLARDGNQRIPEAMAAKLKSDILLNKEVVAIDDENGAVTVHCADGTAYRGKRVVCTLPFSTLRNVRIMPGLTGVQAEAVRTLTYQLITILFLNAKTPFWKEDGLSPSMWTDGPAQWVLAQHLGAAEADVTNLTINARGFGAAYLDRLGSEAAGRCVIAAIEEIRPAAKGKLSLAGFHSWGLDRFSAGDWAVYAPGQPTGLVPVMAQPHGNVFFCGEHTATGNRGMEGALESAERVSIEVLQSI